MVLVAIFLDLLGETVEHCTKLSVINLAKVGLKDIHGEYCNKTKKAAEEAFQASILWQGIQNAYITLIGIESVNVVENDTDSDEMEGDE